MNKIILRAILAAIVTVSICTAAILLKDMTVILALFLIFPLMSWID